MKILITGSQGFIGTHLKKRIPDAICIDKKLGSDLLVCPLPKDIDIIYHLAAQAQVEPSWENPVFDSLNIGMTARLVKEYPNAKIIYANSCASINISSPYGFSKWASGEYLKRFHKNYISCVFPNIYGEESHSVVDIFKGKKDVTIYGDGTHIRDYVCVDDLVEGLLKAQNWPVGEYFMGSGISTTVNQLAQGKSIYYAPERKEDVEVMVPNTTPDWKPVIKVLEYIK
jgi:nucleoside-diphosphate-sugar epimerase